MVTRREAPRILVVMGDAGTAESIVEMIESHYGAPCVTSRTSVACLDTIDLHSIDAALIAFDLPDGDGYDALRSIARRRDDLPVIVLVREQEANFVVEGIRRGASDFIMRVGEYLPAIPVVIEKNLEVARVRRDNLRLQAALSSSLAELKRKNRELEEAASRFEEMASTDLLTNLANRRRLESQLHVMFSEALRYEQDLSCLMIDLDGFKAINDRLGHQRGDELLEMTGRIITAEIRASDLGARYGGDEFVAILPHTPHQTAVTLARRLMAEFRRREMEALGDELRCGMSIGVSCLSLSKPMSPQQLIAHADIALYAAKLSSGVRLMVCGPDGTTASPPNKIAA